MTARFRRFIDGAVLTYLEHQLGSGEPVPTKNALQDLCSFYRRGIWIPQNRIFAVQTTILGLGERHTDPKVQRWVLNALAQLGDSKCRPAVLRALEQYADDQEIVTAGVAALYKISKTAEADLRRLNFPGQMVTLAALQHVRPDQLNLSSLPVNVQTADADTIKSALVVVGLDRAPPHLFDPNYSNAEIVKVVGKHHDAVVSQYSVWAITENDALSIKDLGVDLPDIDAQPDNVQGWIYRLLAMSEEHAIKHLELIEHGAKDASEEARSGLARGLKDTFFERLVPVALDWYSVEPTAEVRQELLDHLVTHADRSPAYRMNVIDAYEHAHAGSAARERMLAIAAKTDLYKEFRKIDYESEGGYLMSKNSIYIGGGSQIGAVSAEGSATNSGQVIAYSQHRAQLLQTKLAEAESFIQALPIPEEDKREAASAITDAKADPNSGTIGRVTSALSRVTGLAGAAAGAEEGIKHLIDGFRTLTGF